MSMGEVIVGLVTDVRPNQFSKKDGTVVNEIEVYISTGQETRKTKGLDNGYKPGQCVAVRCKVAARSFQGGAPYLEFQRSGRITPEELAAFLATGVPL